MLVDTLVPFQAASGNSLQYKFSSRGSISYAAMSQFVPFGFEARDWLMAPI